MASSTKIYVASRGGSSGGLVQPPALWFFHASYPGNVAPEGTVTGPHTQLGGYASMAISGKRNPPFLYVCNQNSVMIYDTGSDGDLAPVQVIQGPATKLQNPARMCVNDAGELFVANFNPSRPPHIVGLKNTITVYGAGAKDNATPIRTITGNPSIFGSDTLMSFPSPSVGLNGELIVATALRVTSVLIFAAGADGDKVAPVRQISGNNTTLEAPLRAIAVESRGELYVLDLLTNGTAAIKVFPYHFPAGNLNIAPLRVVSGPATGLVGGGDLETTFMDMAFSPVWHDGLYVLTPGQPAMGIPSAIVVHALDATGNAPPLRTITGPQTHLNLPNSIAYWAGDFPPNPACPSMLETISVLEQHIADFVIVYEESGNNPLIGKHLQTLERLLATLLKQAEHLGCSV